MCNKKLDDEEAIERGFREEKIIDEAQYNDCPRHVARPMAAPMAIT